MSSVQSNRKVRRLPLTPQTALKEAQRRWGKTACVSFNPRAPLNAEKDLIRTLYAGLRLPRSLNYLHVSRCDVGRVFLGLAFEVLGSGDTFEEAFAEAEARERRK